MNWYVAAFLACFIPGAGLALVEFGSAGANPPLLVLALKWAALASAAYVLCCLVLAVGCGAPGGRERRQ